MELKSASTCTKALPGLVQKDDKLAELDRLMKLHDASETKRTKKNCDKILLYSDSD